MPLAIATVSAGLASLKTAIDITKTISDARDTTRLLEVKLELQGLLLSAREEQAALLDEKASLAARVRELEDWNAEKQRYQLEDVGNGCLAYRLKPAEAESETQHSLCANCFNRGAKSFLVPFDITIGWAKALQCHTCDSEMIIEGQDRREQVKINAKRPAPKYKPNF